MIGPFLFSLFKGNLGRTVIILDGKVNLQGSLIPVWLLCLLIGVVCCLVVFVVHPQNTPVPKPRVFFTLLTTLQGLLWMKEIVSLLIEALELIKLFTGWSSLVVGITIMAIGNSCSDLTVDVALAKQGLPIMALTGIFSGQLFNFLLGFSISGLISSFQ